MVNLKNDILSCLVTGSFIIQIKVITANYKF